MQDFFGLGAIYTLQVNLLVQDDKGQLVKPHTNIARIDLNTLNLGISDTQLPKPVAASAQATNMEKYLALPWSGQYFAGMPINIKIFESPGYELSHWLINGEEVPEKNIPTLSLKPAGNTEITAVLTRTNSIHEAKKPL